MPELLEVSMNKGGVVMPVSPSLIQAYSIGDVDFRSLYPGLVKYSGSTSIYPSGGLVVRGNAKKVKGGK